MKLGMLGGGIGPRVSINIEAIKHAEALGFDSVWTAEAWGGDAVTPAALGSSRRPPRSRSAPPSCKCPRAHLR